MLPKSIKQFADAIAKLPSIGPRQAIRIAFYLAENDRTGLSKLTEAIEELGKLTLCSRCFFVHETPAELCEICANPSRLKSLIAVVEKATDLISLERASKFSGRYLVLGDLKKNGVLEPEQKKRLETLQAFIRGELGGKAEEIILAISPTAYGDLNASMLKTELEPYTKKISRLGRGIPTGGEIEFADEETLKSSLETRR